MEHIPSPSNVLPSSESPIGRSSPSPNVPHSLNPNDTHSPPEASYVQQQARPHRQDVPCVHPASKLNTNLPALSLDQVPPRGSGNRSNCFNNIYGQQHEHDSFSIQVHTPPRAESTHEQRKEEWDAVRIPHDEDVLVRGRPISKKDDEARLVSTAADPAHTRLLMVSKSAQLHDESEEMKETRESLAETQTGVLGLTDSEALEAQVDQSGKGKENNSAGRKRIDGLNIEQMTQMPAEPIPFYSSKEILVNDHIPAQGSASGAAKEVAAQGLRQSRSDRDQLASQRHSRGEFGTSLEEMNAWNPNAKELRQKGKDTVEPFAAHKLLGQSNAAETPTHTHQDKHGQPKLNSNHTADISSPHSSSSTDFYSANSTLEERCPTCNHTGHSLSSASTRQTCTGVCMACNQFIPIRVTALELASYNAC